MPASVLPQPGRPGWAVVGALSVVIPHTRTAVSKPCPLPRILAQDRWHKGPGPAATEADAGGKRSDSAGHSLWTRRDPPGKQPPGENILFSLRRKLHAWCGLPRNAVVYVCPLLLGTLRSDQRQPGPERLGWCLQRSPCCQQPFPLGTLFPPRDSPLALTWRCSSSVSPPAVARFLFIFLFMPAS